MKKMPREEVKAMGLNFTITYDNFGAPVVHPLKENGEDVDVTGDNVEEF